MKRSILILFALLVALLLFWGITASAATYPGTPVVTVAGNLHCGLLMRAQNQVQAYCNYLTPAGTNVLVCNYTTIPLAVGAVPVATSFYCEAQDLASNYIVTWSLMPWTDKSMNYVISWVAVPCAAPATVVVPGPSVGTCKATTSLPAAQIQRGKLAP